MSADKAIIHYFMEEEMLESTYLNKPQPAPTERAREEKAMEEEENKEKEQYPKEGHPPLPPPSHIQLAMV